MQILSHTLPVSSKSKVLLILLVLLSVNPLPPKAIGQSWRIEPRFTGLEYVFGSTQIAIQHHSIFINGDSLLRSVDSGKTWEATDGPFDVYSNGSDLFGPLPSINQPSLNSRFSTDNGNTWNSGGYGDPLETWGFTNMGSIFISYGPSGVVSSTDHGFSWHHRGKLPSYLGSFFNAGKWDTATSVPELDGLTVLGSTLFATSSRTDGRAFYSSIDTGQTWQIVDSNEYHFSTGWPAFAGIDSTLLIMESHHVFSSKDFGKSWEEDSNLYLSGQIYNSGGEMISFGPGVGGGSYPLRVSSDGINWSSESIIDSLSIYQVAYGDGIFFATGFWNSYLSTDGMNWTPRHPKRSGAFVLDLSQIDNKIFTLGYVTTDEGLHWNKLDHWPARNTESDEMAILNRRIIVIDTGIFVSTDVGESWQYLGGTMAGPIHPLMGGTAQTTHALFELIEGDWGRYQMVRIDDSSFSLHVVESDRFGSLCAYEDTIWATTGRAYTWGAATFFVSYNQGNDWKSLALLLPDSVVNGFLSTREKLWVCSDKNVYYNNKGETKWVLADEGLPSGLSMKSLIHVDTVLFLGTDNGTFYRRENDLFWTKIWNSGNRELQCLLRVPDGYLLGTSLGCYLATPSAIQNISENKVSNGIEVYPNPTRETLFVTSPSHVGRLYITMQDVLGRQIKTWQFYLARNENITLPLNDTEPGVYHITSQLEGTIQQVNIVITK